MVYLIINTEEEAFESFATVSSAKRRAAEILKDGISVYIVECIGHMTVYEASLTFVELRPILVKKFDL